jgi:AcrR family transcriptional regulator
VYSLFTSKDGLVVGLGARAFDLLGAAVDALPRTDDPVMDLVEAGLVFRRFALAHPALFRIGVQRIDISGELVRGFLGAADHALTGLHERIRRVGDSGRLGNRSVAAAAWEFHALCEGCAALELRCTMPDDEVKEMWRDGLHSLVAGWRAS